MLIPVCREVDALVGLALVAAVTWAAALYQRVRYAEARAEVRHLAEVRHHERMADVLNGALEGRSL